MTITSEKLRHWAEMASLTSERVSCLSPEHLTQIADHIDAQAARIAELENDELRQRLANAEHQLYMKDLAIQNIKASRRAQFRKRQAAEKELSALADIAGSNAARVKELEEICGQSYQVVGALTESLGISELPSVIKALDNLSKQKLVHKDVLPFTVDSATLEIDVLNDQIKFHVEEVKRLYKELKGTEADNETLVSINSELATELEALREQEIEINDDMALALHHAISDGTLGSDDIEEIKTGLRAAFSHINAAPVVVPDEKQAMIEFCKRLIADEYRTEPEYFKLAKIALASLTAEPVDRIVDDGCQQKIGGVQVSDSVNCVWPVGTKLFTTPPVPEVNPFVVKLLPSINPAMFNADVIFGYRKARAEDIQSIKAAGGSVEDE